jgi:hypothetical protein
MHATVRWWIRTVPRYARRVLAAVFGGTLLLIGVAGLLLPVVPGWFIIIPGLAILAIEFAWARRWLRKVQSTAGAASSALNNGAIGRHWRAGGRGARSALRRLWRRAPRETPGAPSSSGN